MCCRTFFDLTSFKEHLVNKHKCQNLPEKIYTTLKTSGKFLCKFCKIFFQSNENLNKHGTFFHTLLQCPHVPVSSI